VANTRAAIQEQHYPSLFDESREPLAALDGNLRFKRANAAAMGYFNLTREELENRNAAPTLADRLYLGAPERPLLIEQFWNSVYALKLNKTPVELDIFVRPGENCRLRLEYRLSPDTGFEIFARGSIN
jgi:PAS domain-containing protein